MNPCAKTYLVVICILPVVSGCTSLAYRTGIANCAPVYGNWCGENYPLFGYKPQPVDAWDEACRDHDRCYDRGEAQSTCDDEFLGDLERLSDQQLAPRRMHNAYSWFRRDGRVEGWIKFSDEAWGILADCRGGDGRAAEFYCAVGGRIECELGPTSGPGRAGMPCTCNGNSGIIVEH